MDKNKVAAISQADILQQIFDMNAIQAYQRWLQDTKFSTCRMCASCGGDYPNYAGEGFKEYDWGWWEKYRESCSENYHSESGPPSLCCSVNEPPLMLCRTCGGDYPVQVGRKLNRGDWGTWNIKGYTCQGGANFEKTLDEFDICARDRKQCKLCSGECSGGYSKVGKVLRQDDWGEWLSYTPEQCNTNYNQFPAVPVSGDVSVCCLDSPSN